MTASDAAPRTQVERRRDSEEALLDAAAELVAERGVDRSSLASIGVRAGSSRGLPSHHFGTKDLLVARLAQRAQNQIDVAGRAALADADRVVSQMSGLELVLTSVDTYLDRFEHPQAVDRALIVMWGATFPSEASVDGMQDADRRSLDGWAFHVRNGQADGSIRTDLDPRTVAVLIHGLIRGVAATLLTDAGLTEMSRVRETCHAWIAAALQPTADSVVTPR